MVQHPPKIRNAWEKIIFQRYSVYSEFCPCCISPGNFGITPHEVSLSLLHGELKLFFRSFFFCPHDLVLSHSIIYMSQTQWNKEDGKQKERHSSASFTVKLFLRKMKKKKYEFLQAKPQIISNIMHILGTGEKGIDSCLYQELIYIEFCQCMACLRLVQITVYIHSRF